MALVVLLILVLSLSTNPKPNCFSRPSEAAALLPEDSLPAIVQPKITYREHLTLSPWQKFIKYRRFPFKLTINLVVTSLITAFIVINNIQYADYVNASMYIAMMSMCLLV